MRIKKTSNTRAVAGKIVNVNNNSDTDTYSCNYQNNYFGGKVLYSSTGSTSANLSESVANFSYIEIEFKENSSNKKFVSPKIPATETSTVLSYFEVPASASGNIRYFGCSYNINGTTISRSGNYGFATINGSDSVHYENRILITKVIGYK